MTSRPPKRTPGSAKPAAGIDPQIYATFVSDLKRKIVEARHRASLSVNRELILLYWTIGRDILARQEREGWGTKVIDRLADDLRQAFPEMTGLSARNLKYMRSFAEAWPHGGFVQQVVALLPWGHNVRLLDAIKAPEERAWYARQAIEHGWSRNVLAHQIDSNLFARQGSALTNFSRTLPAEQSELAQQILKDPYAFDFLALGPEMLERDLERGLIEHLRLLILELGKGFAFVGSQYHLEVGGQDYYLDLLFYHLRLRCYVVIELKIEDFKPEFAGKMNFYLSAVDDQLRHPHDKPTIGIILCKGRNEVIVEYALRDSSKPMGVAQYQLSHALPPQFAGDLPTVEEFAREFPLMSVMKLRIEIERALRDLAVAKGIAANRPVGIMNMLRDLQRHGIAPSSTQEMLRAIRVMNEASHGVDVDADAAKQAVAIGTIFVAELREIGTGD
ncbi:PDDEXK nuclease domain-containing protein [Bradyrhizobium barranii subsp. apii]|uniref:PDDEXK nuclease domain-containing protein n=1 Tax=Bradyrhizobium barranii subsp. apii TaxID=2819348 RepID=A0A8T5V5Q3_9BRAD|nr:PDDEXK nuclease domain-containing protein [Bradyrhizobium barranii]UPT86933.1 PDDEXK nuclease domain-containing protein [Bradyrhizobium barranii subsp. apii]